MFSWRSKELSTLLVEKSILSEARSYIVQILYILRILRHSIKNLVRQRKALAYMNNNVRKNEKMNFMTMPTDDSDQPAPFSLIRDLFVGQGPWLF